MRHFIAIACLAINIAVTGAQRINVEARPLGNGNTIEIAEILYEKDGAIELVSKSDQNLPHGEFCIGTKDVAGSDCFAYIEVADGRPFRSSFSLHLDHDNNLQHITLSRDGTRELTIHKAVVAPSPNLRPMGRKKKSAKPTPKVVKKVIKDDNGNDVEIEEVEDERSWVQRNWIYLVLPLVVVLMLPEGK